MIYLLGSTNMPFKLLLLCTKTFKNQMTPHSLSQMTKKSRKAENPQISEAGTSKYLTCFASFLCSNQQWHQFCSGSCTHWDDSCRNYLPDLLNALCIKLLKTLENGAFHLTPHRPRPQNPRWHLCESTAVLKWMKPVFARALVPAL